MRPAGTYKSHDLMTYTSRSTDFGQIIKVKLLSKVEYKNLFDIMRLAE